MQIGVFRGAPLVRTPTARCNTCMITWPQTDSKGMRAHIMTQGWKRALCTFSSSRFWMQIVERSNIRPRVAHANPMWFEHVTLRPQTSVKYRFALKQREKFWPAIPRLKLFNFEFKSPAAAKSSNIWNFNVKYTKRNSHYHLMHSISRARLKNWQRAKEEKIPSAAAAALYFSECCVSSSETEPI